ncbi:hypothetical protein [Nocardioides yefusunii]|nr:hypothetical protein [Nocardioides yefusunii]
MNPSEHERDERDAQLILALVGLLKDRTDLNLTKIIRDDVDYVWAKPRETKQGHRKRSAGSWWSEEAWKLKDQKRSIGSDGSTVGTTGEHVMPMRVVSQHLLDLARADRLDVTTVLRLLRLPMAVVSVDEDGLLDRQKMPNGWVFDVDAPDFDVRIWDRYTAAGIKVSELRQLDAQGNPIGRAPLGF